LLFFAKAIVPTVIVVSGPAAAHACTSKRKNDLLAHIAPFIYQSLIVGIVAYGYRCSNVALSIALVLGGIPHVRDRKSDDQMRISTDLFIGWARLPVTKVGNHTAVFTVVSSVGSQGLVGRPACGGLFQQFPF
jgi:hypothetical protein